MSILEIIALIIAGIAVGFINTLAGGGSVISLSLLMVLGLPATIANGTNRLAVLFQTSVASSSFKYQGFLDVRKGLILSIPTILGAILGAQVAAHFNEQLFRKVIAVVILFMIIFIFYNPSRWLKGKVELQNKKIGFLQFALFFIIGIYGGFIHVGIGFFLLGSIVIGAGYDIIKANALKVFIVLMYTIFALAIYIYNDQVYFKYGLILAIGNIIGAFIGTKLAVSRGVNFVRWVVVLIILLTATHLFGIINIKEIMKSIM